MKIGHTKRLFICCHGTCWCFCLVMYMNNITKISPGILQLLMVSIQTIACRKNRRIQTRATRVQNGSTTEEVLTYEARLRLLNLPKVKCSRLRRDTIQAYNVISGKHNTCLEILGSLRKIRTIWIIGVFCFISILAFTSTKLGIY